MASQPLSDRELDLIVASVDAAAWIADNESQEQTADSAKADVRLLATKYRELRDAAIAEDSRVKRPGSSL